MSWKCGYVVTSKTEAFLLGYHDAVCIIAGMGSNTQLVTDDDGHRLDAYINSWYEEERIQYLEGFKQAAIDWRRTAHD